MKNMSPLKTTLASVLVCVLMLFDNYLYWFASLFFDMKLDELVLQRIDAKHAIEASLFAYAVVFPISIILITRLFGIGKGGAKYVVASALILSISRLLLTIFGVLPLFNPVGLVASPIVLAIVGYLLLRFYEKTFLVATPHAN
jgi:hypothetical protein